MNPASSSRSTASDRQLRHRRVRERPYQPVTVRSCGRPGGRACRPRTARRRRQLEVRRAILADRAKIPTRPRLPRPARPLRPRRGPGTARQKLPPPPGATRPLSPEEALRAFRVSHGFDVELVAAEPAIVDPVALDFDEDGRLYVVEMRDYPPGPPAHPDACSSWRIGTVTAISSGARSSPTASLSRPA